MPDVLELFVGREPWALAVPADRRVELRRAAVVLILGSQLFLGRPAAPKPDEAALAAT